MNDPEFRAIYLECDAAFDWAPEDPRLHTLAERAQRWLTPRRARSTARARSRTLEDQAIVRLVATFDGASSPAWNRLASMIRELRANATPLE